MIRKDNQSEDRADFLKKAEDALRRQGAPLPEEIAELSPDEVRQILHDLRVHQVELEMQNEELRTAYAELDAVRARYFDLYDLAPVGYCTLSEKGLILEANLTATTLIGVARSLVNQPISRFILNEDQDIYYLHHKRVFETGEPQECQLRMVKPDGEHYWVHLTASAVIGDVPTCRVVMGDITERKRIEEALQNAFAEVKTLRGILPICMGCKMIRDDHGYWRQVEAYVGEHTEAMFSHSLCPACLHRLYPQFSESEGGRNVTEEDAGQH